MDSPLPSTPIETAAPFDPGADVLLGETMIDGAQRAAFRRDRTAPSVNWHLRDVTLFPPLALVYRKGQLIDATRFSVFDSEVESAKWDLRSQRLRFTGPRAYMGFNRPCVSHFHIISQIIPAIAGYQADPAYQDGSLFLPALNEKGRASQALTARALELARIDISNVIRLGGSPIEVGELIYSSYLTSDDGPSMFARSVYDCMIQHAVLPPAPPRPRAIYISRGDTPARPMRNEAALIALLERCGVTPVVLSGLSLDEQIAMFQAADLIVGAHGAGLVNVVFSHPGAVLYEILPSHYVNPCVAVLAQMRGAHYWCDVHQADPTPDQWRHQVAWSVDLDGVERRVEQIRRRYPRKFSASPA